MSKMHASSGRVDLPYSSIMSKSYLNGCKSEESCRDLNEGSFCNSEINAEDVHLEDLDVYSISNGHIFHDLGNAFGRVLQLSDNQIHFSDVLPYSNCYKISNELEVLSPAITDSLQFNSDQIATCLHSEAARENCFSTDGIEGQSLCTVLEEDPISLEPIEAFKSTPLNLLSAMKGGRERSKLPPRTNLSVTWAPEVYDPPVSSVVRRIKSRGHIVYYKPNRKDLHKQKTSKSNPFHRSSSESKVSLEKRRYRRLHH